MSRPGRTMAMPPAMLVLFIACAALYAVVLLWLLHNNYSSDFATSNWVTVRALLDGATPHIENHEAGLMYGQLLLLMPFYTMPSLLPYAQYIVSIVAVALLLAIWHRDLAQAGYLGRERALLLTLVAVNPGMVWCATGGGAAALPLLLLYLLHTAILRLRQEGAIRAYIATGVLMALYLYIDAMAVYLLVLLLPAVMLFTPIRQLKNAPQNSFIIIGLPLMVIAASWLYFNWVFFDNPLAFVSNGRSAFLGARAEAVHVDWLFEYGGSLLKSAGVGFIYLFAAFPILSYLLWNALRHQRRPGAHLAILTYPALAVALATMTYYLATPLQIMVVVHAIVMAEINGTRSSGRNTIAPLVLFLSLGLFTSGYLVARETGLQLAAWRGALLQAQERPDTGEAKLGRWLATHRAPTLLDLHSGFKVVAARGDALDLVTPYSDSYRLQLQRTRPDVPQIAVPDPDSDAGRIDEIARVFPGLYDFGMEGYELAYESDGWRVFRKI